MKLRLKAWMCLLALALPLGALAEGFAVPQDFQADVDSGSLTLQWSAVDGAGLYRVAIFDAAQADGKRPLLAAVWVKGTKYSYNETATVAKAGKFPSTVPLPLPTGRRLRAMVAAAGADGSDKGEWAGIDVDPISPAPTTPQDTATPSPMVSATATPTVTATAAAGKRDAELEVQGGGEEFKQSPDAAVLDVDDAAGGAAAAGAATGLATGAASAAGTTAGGGSAADSSAASSDAADGSPMGLAKGLNAAGRFDQAETAFRAILEKEPENADAWEGLGDSFAGRRMKLEAKESYEKALSLNSGKTRLKDWIDQNVRH
jgi:tetratricopeptide (TPR) repeat protein